MNWLGEQANTKFIGQAVEVPGTAMSNTLVEVPKSKLLEFPVSEDFQMGASLGMALNGTIPVTIFPRWNFLLLATNQLVNHIDKSAIISHGEYSPKLIIRTAIGSERPLNPQVQHTGDFSESFRLMLKNIEIVLLKESNQIFEAYQQAYYREDGKSTLLIEYGDFYNEK